MVLKHLGRRRSRWKDGIKMALMAVGHENRPRIVYSDGLWY